MMCDKRKKRKAGATLFSMDKITQGMLFKQAVIEYSLKHGVTSAAKPTDRNMRRRNPHAGLVVFWGKLRQRDYTRAISGLYKLLHRIDGKPVKLPNPKYIPKPYEKMQYPGQRVQIDVKYVPSICLVGEAAGEKYYQ